MESKRRSIIDNARVLDTPLKLVTMKNLKRNNCKTIFTGAKRGGGGIFPGSNSPGKNFTGEVFVQDHFFRRPITNYFYKKAKTKHFFLELCKSFHLFSYFILKREMQRSENGRKLMPFYISSIWFGQNKHALYKICENTLSTTYFPKTSHKFLALERLPSRMISLSNRETICHCNFLEGAWANSSILTTAIFFPIFRTFFQHYWFTAAILNQMNKK